MTSALDILNGRGGELSDPRYAYKLAGNQFASAADVDGVLEVDPKTMSLWLPIADGNRRDGVGDLLEVEGIKTWRHAKNAIALFDHGKNVQLPIGMAYERDEQGRYDRTRYTFVADPVSRQAGFKAYFWQGQYDIPGVDKAKQYDHATFCQQLFKMCDDGLLGAGSIGYQVIHAKNLQPDFDRGTPPGLHLLSILMLEGSLVVLPANGDTVRKMLAMPEVCGKPLSPYFVKSLTPYAAPKKAQMGYEGGKAQHGGRGGGKVPRRFDSTIDPFRPGDRVISRERLFYRPDGGKLTQFMKPGERGTVHSISGGMMKITNAVGQTAEFGQSQFRKNMAGGKPVDDMKALRLKYRKSAKGLVRRLKKSSPGKAMVYVWGKDIDAAEKMARSKGLKFQRQGYHSSGAEKVKLMGDDDAIDEVAKHFGRPFRGGVKKIKSLTGATKVARKELKREVKAAPEGMGGKDPRDLNGDGVVSQVEKWGAQMMRHAHDHFSQGMKTYDEMMGVLEDEDVRKHFTTHMGNIGKFLDDNEALWEKKYGSGSEHNYPPLAGAAKDLTEDEAEDVAADLLEEEADTEADELVDESDDKDMDTMGDPAVPADSSEYEPADPEEAVEGMEEDTKSLRAKYRKGDVKKKVKAVCPCGKPNCDCGKKEKIAPAVAAAIPAVASAVGGALSGGEKGQVREAAGFLGEVSQPDSAWQEEQRFKAYHYHKTLEGIGRLEEANDELNEGASGGPDIPPAEFEPGAGAKSQPGSPEWELEEAAEPAHQTKGSHRKMCKDASNFLGDLARQTAINGSFRQQAGVFSKQLGEMATEGGGDGDPTAADNGVVMEDEVESPEPGEVRESSLKMIEAERKALIETQRQMAELNKSLLSLVGQ